MPCIVTHSVIGYWHETVVCLPCSKGALPIHLFRHFCCRMYCSATIHFVTDRQTDRRHYHAMHCNTQYDRLLAWHRRLSVLFLGALPIHLSAVGSIV